MSRLPEPGPTVGVSCQVGAAPSPLLTYVHFPKEIGHDLCVWGGGKKTSPNSHRSEKPGMSNVRLTGHL